MKCAPPSDRPRYGNQRVMRSLCALCAFALLGALAGCSREHYKEDADRETYGILEDKWQDDFGPMVNYRVSETAPNDVEMAAEVPSTSVLNLADAIRIATEYSREYQSQKEALYLSALALTAVRHQYARQWFGTVDAFYDSSEAGEDITAGASAGVNQNHLIGDGILVGTGLAIDWARFLTGDPETTLASVLTATVTAPLIGAGAGKTAREDLTQAERNVLYRIRTFNRYRKTFVTSIIDDYYRVLLERARVGITEASYQRRVDSTNQLRMEVEVGQRPAYDLGEAEQDLLRAENSVVTTRQRYEQALDNFKIRLSIPTQVQVELDPSELTALQKLGISKPEYTEEDAITIALVRRLDLANTRDEVDDAERRLVLAAEGLGPQMNLVASANVESTPETEFLRLRFHEGRYRLGLETDLGLDQKAERNAYRRALITAQQTQRNYDEEWERVKLDVRQAYRDLLETAETYRIQQIGLELAEKRVEVEKLSLQYGRGTVRLLLEAEDSLVQTQNDVLSALVDHMLAKMSFFRDIGVMQVRPDGMWE
ncbi:MAG: TolC family protein [Phycisphaerales bacterium]|nr:MAG: TolC family protein [Phycisphaerales bacterium]